MRRPFAALAVIVLAGWTAPDAGAQSRAVNAPIVFVHGMGSSAADIGRLQFRDLLSALAKEHPARDVCQAGAQPDIPWRGSPCVFRYVEDAAETDDGPNDSQSGVQSNADKLADEIDEVYDNAGRRPVVLVGYSMGGAIIRTYLATHRKAAARRVDAVVLIDAVTSGSWGYAFATEFPRRVEGSLGARLEELMRSLAASSAAVDFTRPATRDLTPRSDHLRKIAPMELPRNVSYYTFWGNIGVTIERRLLHYELPAFDLPSMGDLGLLPGDADPTHLPELGGQRFSPGVEGPDVALDVPHTTRIALDASVVSDLLSLCGHQATEDATTDCSSVVREHFNVPNAHTAIPSSMGRVMVEEPALGGRVTLLDAVLTAIGRHA